MNYHDRTSIYLYCATENRRIQSITAGCFYTDEYILLWFSWTRPPHPRMHQQVCR